MQISLILASPRLQIRRLRPLFESERFHFEVYKDEHSSRLAREKWRYRYQAPALIEIFMILKHIEKRPKCFGARFFKSE